MARLYSDGNELNDITGLSGMGFNGIQSNAVTFRSGSFSYKDPSGTGGQFFLYTFAASDQTSGFFVRTYIRIEAAPGGTVDLLVGRTSGGSNKFGIRINANRTLQLRNYEDAVDIGSPSSALSLNTWYRVELSADTTTIASTSLDARIDGISFASGTADLVAGFAIWVFGEIATGSTSTVIYYDDIAMNSSTGSFQNSWPGAGAINHYHPSTTGDVGAWTRSGTDSGANWSQVNEVTPNDLTNYTSSNTLNQEDLFNLADTGAEIGSTDTINVVAVGVRFRGAGASANASFKLEIEASASGTIEQSAAITPASTTWVTNAAAAPQNYSLTLYDLPGASTTAWTKTDLDAAQIGYNLTTTSTNAANISTLWLQVDSTPAVVAAATSVSTRMLRGLGM